MRGNIFLSKPHKQRILLLAAAVFLFSSVIVTTIAVLNRELQKVEENYPENETSVEKTAKNALIPAAEATPSIPNAEPTPSPEPTTDFIPETLTNEKGEQYFKIDSVSPDGKYAIVSHAWNGDGDSSYILLYDIGKNQLLSRFDLLSKEFGYAWSPDSKKVCVSRLARIWMDTSIVDIEKNSSVNIMDMDVYSKLNSLEKLNYKLNENRPDPFYELCEWSPDSTKLLMFYQWTDSDMNRQSGSFVYHLGDGSITRINQNQPDIRDHPQSKKPDGFKW